MKRFELNIILLLSVGSVFAAEPLLYTASEWISVAGAPVASEVEKKRHRAADGTSVFWHRHVNAKEVKSAKWSATGLGVFELYVNGGDPVGKDFLGSSGMTMGQFAPHKFN